ncbi:MAG: SiaB family protein kinase [Campylobacterales bacterium]
MGRDIMEELYRFKEELDKNGLIATFSGPLSQGMLNGLGKTLRAEMCDHNVDEATKSKVFSILVELIQNMINYSAEGAILSSSSGDIRFGIVAIGLQSSQYVVLCGNRVEMDKKEKLDNYLKKLLDMDKEQLKEYYKKRRRKSPSSDSKGAGLGFIEIARKSSQPFEYNIRTVDDEYAFFTIKTYI